MVLLRGGFDDCHEFALQRPVVPFSAFPQALHELVGGIFDGKVDRHGSKSAPGRMLVLAHPRTNAPGIHAAPRRGNLRLIPPHAMTINVNDRLISVPQVEAVECVKS
jgi:hypothetical protein